MTNTLHSEKYKSLRTTIFLVIAAIILNSVFSFANAILHIPLFLDTIFTVAITFYCGLIPGIIVAIIFNPLMTLVWCIINNTDFYIYDCLYAICGILIVVVTWALSRNKNEFYFNRTVTILYLLIISFTSSFASCVSATILDTFIRPFFERTLGLSMIDNLSVSFQKLNFSVFLSYFLPRIPITVLDRIICTFSGFGIYRLLVREKKTC